MAKNLLILTCIAMILVWVEYFILRVTHNTCTTECTKYIYLYRKKNKITYLSNFHSITMFSTGMILLTIFGPEINLKQIQLFLLHIMLWLASCYLFNSFVSNHHNIGLDAESFLHVGHGRIFSVRPHV